MTIAAGTRLGPYEVVSAIGAGGMGEVYRARDTSLGRDVALKILPDVFAADADRLARFEREAQALASLNHPHIAQVYAIEQLPGESGATTGRAIVMELVEGEDLSVRIARGPIPIDETLPIARQIATALEAAHDAGIVHRDLKPANIKVRADGTAKVLDFGLAKALGGAMSGDGPGSRQAGPSPSLANSPTLTARATELGVVLGTAAYMAPEQAKGRAVDRRADVWAFGVVLYEMLTGRRAFGGDDVTEVMAAVIRDTPDMGALPAATPPAVRRLLRRALEKDVRRRLRDMGDAGVELDEALSGTSADDSGRAATGDGSARERGTRRSPLVWIAATVLVGVAAAVAAWALKPAPPADRPITRFSFVLDEGVILNNINNPNLAWSRDGRRIAYRANATLFVRDLDGVAPREILRSNGVPQWFSPDGNILLFRTTTGASTVPVAGGPAIEIVQSDSFGGAHWFDDHTIVYSDTHDILSIPSTGGAATVIVKGSSEATNVYPQVLPGGRALLYTTVIKNSPVTMIKRLGPDEAPRELLVGVGGARYVPTGHLVYGLDNRLMAVPFDLDRLEVVGTAVPLPEAVYVGNVLVPQAAFSDNGSLAFVTDRQAGALQLSWVDGKGQSTVALPPLRNYSDAVLSPDGRRAAFHLWDEDNDVWVADLERGTLTRATSSPDEEETPVWSPDGRELAYAASRGRRGIFRKAADGGASAPEQKIFESDEHTHINGWSKDGTLIVEIRRASTGNDLITVDLKTGEAKDLLASQFNEGWSRLSPDGRWLAYVSNESSTNQVYVQPYPAMNTRVQVSTDGGVEPVWSRDGRRLYFRTAENVVAAALTSTSPLEFGTPTVLFADRFAKTQGTMHTHYDVAPDGRLLMIANPASQKGPDRQEIHIVLNWFEELKRVVPVK